MNRDFDRCAIEVNRKSTTPYGLRFASKRGSELVFFFTEAEFRDLQDKIVDAQLTITDEAVIPFNR